MGSLACDQFVVLDERSAEDNTCLVYHRTSTMPEGSDEAEWDEEKLLHEWKVWRVKFVVAWQVCATVCQGDDVITTLWADKTKAYWDENGIFQLPHLEGQRP